MSADVWLFCTDRVFPFFILFSGGKRCKFLGDFGMVRLATGDWGMGTGWVEDHYAGAVVVGRLTKKIPYMVAEVPSQLPSACQ